MLRTYDPQKVNVIYNNHQLRMFGDNLFTLERDEDNVSLKKGAKGDSTYVINANKAAKLTITLQPDSPDIPYIERMAEQNLPHGLTVMDANDSGTLIFAQNVMVSKLPARSRSKTAEDVSIVFIIPDLKLTE